MKITKPNKLALKCIYKTLKEDSFKFNDRVVIIGSKDNIVFTMSDSYREYEGVPSNIAMCHFGPEEKDLLDLSQIEQCLKDFNLDYHIFTKYSFVIAVIAKEFITQFEKEFNKT